MSITLQPPKLMDLQPRLTVIGVGGAGCNAVNNMIAAGLTGVEFVVANTDAQALQASSAEHRIQLGAKLTEGLGAGAEPAVGQAAAEESIDEIRAQISGSHMVFVAAGMGGGTGTGAAAVVARAARDMGILTVGVVTRPFQFEGSRRLRMADRGIEDLKASVDTLIVIPNQNLFRIANEKTTFAEAFVLADQVLYSGVACIVDLIIKEGLINLDFADVRAVMHGMGTAMMGTGEASGDRRAIMAAEEAIANPLLDDVKLKGAQGVLLSITGGPDMTLFEVDEAASRVRQEVDPEANIIVGATFDDSLDDRIRVSIVASGMHPDARGPLPSSASAAQNSAGSGGMHAIPPPPPLMTPNAGSAAAAAPPSSVPPSGASTLAASSHTQSSNPQSSNPQSSGTQSGDTIAGGEYADRGGLSASHTPMTSSDLQQRLSDAMHEQSRAESVSASQSAPAPEATTSAPPPPTTWQAPGNVTITEGAAPHRGDQSAYTQPRPPSDDGRAPPQPHYQHQPAPPPGAPFDERRFHPQPAARVPNRGPMTGGGGGLQMPGLDQFPVVGQRAYEARQQTQQPQRSAHPDQPHQRREPATHAASQPGGYGGANAARPEPGVAPERPKRGLFERLAGLGRSQNESPDAYQAHRDGSRGAPPVPNGYGQASREGSSQTQNEDESGDDLPVIFNAKGR